MHLTIVDDSKENLKSYGQLLEGTFELTLLQRPEDVFDFLAKSSTDLVILDLHMPQMNGFEMYRKIREFYDTPIIFLSADPSEEVMIEGLNLGAEDFIAKPVSLKELVARIKNKVQRSGPSQKEDCVEYEGFKLYHNLQAADVDGKRVHFTPIEYKLISIFVRNPNQIYSRESIANILWPHAEVQNQNIDTHLSNLRRKLHPFSKNIKTIKSRGYVLRISQDQIEQSFASGQDFAN